METNYALMPTEEQNVATSNYIPSKLEAAMMLRSRYKLHYDVETASACSLYRNKSEIDLYQFFQQYVLMLRNYSTAVRTFSIHADDIRKSSPRDREGTCESMDKLLGDSFEIEHFLSRTLNGYIEPLLPPLRHPLFCATEKIRIRKKWLTNIEYLVHDFGDICRNLDTKSRTVFFDLGASLEFHGGAENPVLSLIELYSQFGIKFDHIYAFEYTFIPPQDVFNAVPKKILPFYHWYNIAVEAIPSSDQNPWTSILAEYTEDDFVVIKVDIDSPGIEAPLVQQLLDRYSDVVDQLYYEHHVKMKDMDRHWGDSGNGTLQDSLELFTQFRTKGIAAHSWV